MVVLLLRELGLQRRDALAARLQLLLQQREGLLVVEGRVRGGEGAGMRAEQRVAVVVVAAWRGCGGQFPVRRFLVITGKIKAQ